ncbi:MAG: hypothetical protein ABI577_11440 [bacterium]
MNRLFRFVCRLSIVLPVAVVSFHSPSIDGGAKTALAESSPVTFQTENLDGSQFVYVVFHALDRDGFCQPPVGAVSLHPVIGLPVDFVIEAGDGVIIESSDGSAGFGRTANAVKTFSTAVNAASASPIRAFKPLIDGLADECQAWIRVSQSIPGPLRVLVTAPGDDGGQVGFLADLARPEGASLTLNFRWSLITWSGTDAIAPGTALKGPSGGNDISGQTSAIYGWDAAAQRWLGYFPSGANIPGANDLTALKTGAAYWIAINGPSSVSWPVS